MGKNSGKSYRIRIQPGRQNLIELLDDLAKQVVRKNMDQFRAGGSRVKKMTAAGRAA